MTNTNHEATQDIDHNTHHDVHSDDKVPPLQTIIQINIYRYRNAGSDSDDESKALEFLLLKRIDNDDHFWQPITQPLHKGDSISEALKQAAAEHAGILNFRHLSHELYTYEWYAHGERGRDIVFAAEIDPETAILPDLKHYSSFEWLPFSEALLKLKWDGNKQSLRQLRDHLETKAAGGATATEAAKQEDEVLMRKVHGSRLRHMQSHASKTAVPKVPPPLPDRPVDKRLPDVDEEGTGASVFPL